MSELLDWYLQYGVTRGNDPSDPDCALRKITVAEWLDPLMAILEKSAAIREHFSQKACVALWGPSAAGKSTMLSGFIDGDDEFGRDSALTWSPELRTRFSPPKDGMTAANDALIFNPFKFGTDASGVVTRFVLKSERDGVNPQFPVEIKLTNRAQLIEALSLGYASECETQNLNYDWSQLEMHLNKLCGEASGGPIDPEAYSLLKEIASILEQLKGDQRFNSLFRQRGEWERTYRRQLISAPGLLANPSNCEKMLQGLFWDDWDGVSRLSRAYRDLMTKLQALSSEWQGCRIFASLEVAALLVDIDSFKSYRDNPNAADAEYKVHQQVSCLDCKREGNEIHLFVGATGNPRISGDEFCYFQALCSELVAPLKQEQLEKRTNKDDFLPLLQKCDVLDFPGVSNFNPGNNIAEGNNQRIVLDDCTDVELFCKIFKRGKTQCFVYNYAEQYGIDAFIILTRADRPTSQTSQLNDGIGKWMRSFDPSWKRGAAAPLPIFLDMTFFSKALNDVGLNGVANGLDNCYAMFSALNCADKRCARFFCTTYPQFPDGRIVTGNAESIIPKLLEEGRFLDSTGMGEENLEPVFGEDGGVGYMLRNINEAIDPVKRQSKCREILAQNKARFIELMRRHLPSEEEVSATSRRLDLEKCRDRLEDALTVAEMEFEPDKFQMYANEIKQLLSVNPLIFDALPTASVQTVRNPKVLREFCKEQIQRWYNDRTGQLVENSELWNTDQQLALLGMLRDLANTHVGELAQTIQRNGQFQKRELALDARFPFAVAFSNVLQTGRAERDGKNALDERNPDALERYISADVATTCCRGDYPHYDRMIRPMMDLLNQMVENPVAQMHQRPPQPGDAQLQHLLDTLLAQDFNC